MINLLLIYALVFVAVVATTWIAYHAIQEGVSQYEEKYLTHTLETLDQMFLFFAPQQVRYINIVSMILFGILFFLISFNIFLALAGLVIGFIIPKMLLKYAKKKRAKKFDEQLVDALDTLANALKAGSTLLQGMDVLAQKDSPPLSQEFGLLMREHRLGVSLEDALENLRNRVESEALDLFVTATNIARGLGGNLSEIFEVIANTIRERQKIEGKIRALTAQGKMQGIVVGLLPIIFGVMLYLVEPSMINLLLDKPLGWVAIGCIIIMEIIGASLIKKIVTIDI